MAPWIFLLFTFVAVLNAQAALKQMSLAECCRAGQEHGQTSQDCASLPLLSEFPACRMAQEQCCTAVLERSSCEQGIGLALGEGTCEVLSGNACETRSAKMCCQCCILGREALADGLSCELKLPVAYQCGAVSHQCCLQGLAEATGNGTLALENKLPNDQDEDPLNDKCTNTQCSQRCLGNNSCGCFQGYRLKPDGRNCEDINECLLGAHHCQLGEQCINKDGSYRCQREASCGTGYELTDSNICQDIDECEIGTHNCGQELVCRNTQGSFRCQPRHQCGPGFFQDALGNCIDINECLSQSAPCPARQTCINTVGSYVCQRSSPSCGRGYHLSEDGARCVDVDECMGTDGACAGHNCINTVGSFRCQCRAGYTFNSISRACEDINECRHFPGRLCAHKCENVQGSYQCSCTMGFKLASDGRNCEDVNECESNPCSQECANVYGSYQCYCRRGYQLSDVDGTTCEDIDECALPTGGHLCAYRCHNVPGSFQCSCPPVGYTLGPSGRSCQDVDECLTATHNCTESESCFNVQGGFRCLSFECPDNYRRAGEIHCERLACDHSSECLALALRITHYRLTFPTHIPVPTDIFRMGPSNSVPGDDIQLDIVSGNEEGLFGVQELASGGVIMVQQPITEARDFQLTAKMNLRRYGTVSTYLAKISVFVTHEQLDTLFAVPDV
ncbi:fibulin-1-like isoform X3 [Paramormyrops kingsleyae]|uniref:fibulin-1-like isoform X3 n=1 Tax=Paramormyrops kingsleyae TaxID=1676925 RepID=UPI000CD616E4|nr:fibulin-1-like isoform X3 [Paramormyrops kingsleyae]